MGTPIANATNYELIRGYSPVGDMSVFFLCILLLILMHETFLKKSRALHLFRLCIILLCAAACANTGFYYTAYYWDTDELLIVLRAIHHVCLLLIFGIYIDYLALLIALPKEKTRAALILINGLCILAGIIDVLCPIVKYDFYRDPETGNWVAYSAVQPFSVAYMFFFIVLFYILVRYRRRLPSHLHRVLMLTGAASFTLATFGSHFKHNPYLTLTFLLPLVVVLYMVHANSYSTTTGAMNADTMNDFFSLQHTYRQKRCFMCLRFDTDSDFMMPDELGKVFYNFWNHTFRKAFLFRPTTEIFVLAILTNDVEETMKKARGLYDEAFLKYFATYRVPYHVIAFDNLDFCQSLEQFYEIFDFFAGEMKQNSYKQCDAEDYKRYQNIKYISSQLKDISDKRDLDDPRVLVYCQPVLHVASHTFDTAEALMRLQLEETGMVFPDRFIPLAEKLGYIHPLSMIILNKTCREIHRLQEEGYTISRISVNLSTQELSIDTFMDEFCEIVRSNGISFDSIAVELTESRDDTEYKTLLDRVNQFKELGVCTYLDDFGTGYSNFDRILSLKLDVVKFDRSLLLMADKDNNSRFLLDYFSTGFEKMGYKVLYEGVETSEQEEFCIRSHTDYLQGYKFSKPIPIERLREFL